MTYNIVTPIQGQPASASLYGVAVKNAIADLDTRVAALEGHAPGLSAVHTRNSNSGNTTSGSNAEFGVMRMDNIPVFGGYTYEIVCTPTVVTPSTTGTIVTLARLRAQQGSVATVSSSLLGFSRQVQLGQTVNTTTGQLIGIFSATADSTLSALVTMNNVTGTGTVFWSATYCPVIMYVKLIGPTVADYGTGAEIL